MKFVPLSIHLQTIAELYEKCAQLSEQLNEQNQQLNEQNQQIDQDAKSTDENTQTSENIEIDEIQNVSPKSQITKTKENVKQNIKKIKTQNNKKVQNQCSDCNQIYEVKVKKKSKKHKHTQYQKKSKKSRQLIKQLKSQKQTKQFEINLNERTNSEQLNMSQSEINNIGKFENQDQEDNIQDSPDEFEISL